MALGLVSLSIVAALSATVGASTTVVVGETPFVSGGELQSQAQFILSPLAELHLRTQRARGTVSYTPALSYSLPEAPTLEQPQLQHLGKASASYAASHRLDLSFEFDGAGGRYQQYQLRSPLSGGGGLATTGTQTVKYLTLTATGGATYALSRRWSYQATVGANMSEATIADGLPLITPQKSVRTSQGLSYIVTNRSQLGGSGRAEVIQAGSRQLLSWSLGLTHGLRLSVPTQLTLSAGVAQVRAMPGQTARPGDELLSASLAATYGGTVRMGVRRAAVDVQASWQPVFDPLLDQTRAVASVAATARVPLSRSLSAGAQASVSVPTNSQPASRQLDEMLAYVNLPISYQLSREWSFDVGARSSWSSLHWRLPFSVNNSAYSLYATVTFALPVGPAPR